MTLPVIDLRKKSDRSKLELVLAKLRNTSSSSSDAARTVSNIIDDVRQQGDDAVVKYMRQWTDPAFTAGRIAVQPGDIRKAMRELSPTLKAALKRAIDHVREYQKHVMPKLIKPVTIDGAELGLRFTPVDSAGLLVPGGKAAYPSSLIMLAVPALVAGVPPEQLFVATPPPTRQAGQQVGDVSPLVLGTCGLLGITRVYRIGGAQAVAALAFGTKSVNKVDMVAGPGNVFVQLAKAQLNGVLGTDNGFYGPSEIVTLADDSADPRYVAADLIAQAEHDPGKCFLLVWSAKVLNAILAQVELQRIQRIRQTAIASALQDESAAILCRDQKQAIEIANTLAAEHVNLAVRNPRKLLSHIRHGGEFFLGDQTPVAAGDYYAGPSHCLPTGTTARFASGVSVYTFLKRSGTVWYPKGMSHRTINDIADLAEAEGLDGHAHSARVRGIGAVRGVRG